MAAGIFRRIFGRKKAEDAPPQEQEPVNDVGPDPKDGAIITVNTDNFPDEERDAFYTEAAKMSEMDIFAGSVRHGYSKSHVADTDKCPRCHAPTRQQYSHFIYATQEASRVMFAPAGYFCTGCPTVIVDEDLIESGIGQGRFEYRGVVGIDYENKKSPDPFETWNGEEVVHVLDEDLGPM